MLPFLDPDRHLRPLVHCPTRKYNMKVRFGRGFTLPELEKAGISKRYARTVGIAVDYRRRNTNVDTLNANAHRLTVYKSKLIVFPRRVQKKTYKKDGTERVIKPKKGVSAPEEQAKAVQQTKPFPYRIVTRRDKARAITEKEKTDSAYLTIRKERGKMRKIGDAIRKKRAAEAGVAAAKAQGGKGGKAQAKEDAAAAEDE